MRFFDSKDEERLQAMVTQGAITREPLEVVVGNRSVSLLEALVENENAFPAHPWIAWGVRQGLTRLHGASASGGFLRELSLHDDQRERLLETWRLPFARNAFGQNLVATVPGWHSAEEGLPGMEGAVVPCILTLRELGELRRLFLQLG